VRADGREASREIWHELFRLGVIADVVAQQLLVFLFELERRESQIQIVKFLRRVKSARRRCGDLEAFRRVDSLQRLEEFVAGRFLRMTENVKAADPRREH